MPKTKVLPILLFSFFISSCATPTPEVIVVTATPEPTKETPTETTTPTEKPTNTPEPTDTPESTDTPEPTNTPPPTLEPMYVTHTALAISAQETQQIIESARNIRTNCPVIEWVELSEVPYASDHEGECVYIKGRVSDINFEENLLEISIGFYSAWIAIGLDNLANTPGRLTEDMWINIYGTVHTDRWVSINNFTGDETPTVGIQARLIEGPNNLVWIE